MTRIQYYDTLHGAIVKAIKDIRENDSPVTTVEVHGPHSRYEIVYVEAPPLAGNNWRIMDYKK